MADCVEQTTQKTTTKVDTLCLFLCLCFSAYVVRNTRGPCTASNFPTACFWRQPRGRSLRPLDPSLSVHCLPDTVLPVHFKVSSLHCDWSLCPPSVEQCSLCSGASRCNQRLFLCQSPFFLPPSAPCMLLLSKVPLPEGSRSCLSFSFSACPTVLSSYGRPQCTFHVQARSRCERRR